MYRDIPASLELPSDRPRPQPRTWAGATLTDTIDGDVTRALKKIAAKNGATLFSALFASLQILIGRLGASDDVVLTVPMAAQTKLEEQSLVGHCVNFLPIRCAFKAGERLADRLIDLGRSSHLIPRQRLLHDRDERRIAREKKRRATPLSQRALWLH